MRRFALFSAVSAVLTVATLATPAKAMDPGAVVLGLGAIQGLTRIIAPRPNYGHSHYAHSDYRCRIVDDGYELRRVCRRPVYMGHIEDAPVYRPYRPVVAVPYHVRPQWRPAPRIHAPHFYTGPSHYTGRGYYTGPSHYGRRW